MNDKWATRIVNFTKNLPWKIRRPIYEQIGLISCGGGMTSARELFLTTQKRFRLERTL